MSDNEIRYDAAPETHVTPVAVSSFGERNAVGALATATYVAPTNTPTSKSPSSHLAV